MLFSRRGKSAGACRRWHRVESGDTCWALEQQYDVSKDDLLRWNPNVGGEACDRLWLGYAVCVGM